MQTDRFMECGPILCDLAGPTLSAMEQEILTHPLVGGIILFARNYQSPAQLLDLVRQIRLLKPAALITVDQEGGRVQRFKQDFSALPCLRKLGELYDGSELSIAHTLSLTEQLGELMAMEVLALGVDISFAPVVDLDKNLSTVIGNRAFHGQPEVVAELALAYVKGMHQAGMAATAKHFPGHGAVVADSHNTLPYDRRSINEINHDWLPFRQLMRNGLEAIMTAHIVFEQLDGVPVTFSHYWLQTVLRQQLGFQGVVISDDLTMHATQIMGDLPTRAQRALAAGCDMLLICNDPIGLQQVLHQLQDTRDIAARRRIFRLYAKVNRPEWETLEQSSAWQRATQALQTFEQQLIKLGSSAA